MKSTVRDPTPKQIRAARKWFEKNEPRALFYRAATELVELALRRATSLNTCEALAVLLQTWNRAYYRYQGRFDAAHFADIDTLLADNEAALAAFRARKIDGFSDADSPAIRKLFNAFDDVLGQVGAAKALHLLAPGFFPLWDNKIAQAYTGQALPRGMNGDRYLRFMQITQAQCAALANEPDLCDALKALDEFNYYTFTQKPRLMRLAVKSD